MSPAMSVGYKDAKRKGGKGKTKSDHPGAKSLGHPLKGEKTSKA